MKLPNWIEGIRGLAGQGPRPLDRLERAKPVEAGREAVAGLSPGGAGLEAGTLSLLQGALCVYFDCFDEAHGIAQDQEGLFGNWLHAIAHRREPDAANAKYWYRRVQAPPALLRAIGRGALERLETRKVPELAELRKALDASKSWEPEAFTDLAEAWRRKDPALPAYRLLADIQEIEWRGWVGFFLEQKGRL